MLRVVLVELSKLIAPLVPFLSESIFRSLRTDGDPESVHLCRYPAVDDAAIDGDLECDMAFARRVVALGHQARNQAGIRVRQPLSRVVIERPKSGALSEEVARLIEFELNVESVEWAEQLESYFGELSVPNYRSLGPRLGPKGQAVGEWIKRQAAASLREGLTAGSMSAEIDGEKIEIFLDDVLFEAVLTDEWVDGAEGDCRILLGVAIDERLRERGTVRELTHRIQLARKKAGFEVTDRIEVGYEGDERLCETLEANLDEIADEVLAVRMTKSLPDSADHTETLDLDGETITIGLTRVDATEAD